MDANPPEDTSLSSSNMKRSSSREESTEKKHDDNKTLYCICRSTDTKRFMIACDSCSDWFHGECVKILKKESKNIHMYHCQACVEKNPTLQSIIYKKKYLRELQKEKEEQQILSTMNCGNCIGCFRSADCDKCPGCTAEVRTQCDKRRCVQADFLLQKKANAGAMPRPRRERQATQSTEESDDGMNDADSPSPHKNKRGRKKGWRKDGSHVVSQKQPTTIMRTEKPATTKEIPIDEKTVKTEDNDKAKGILHGGIWGKTKDEELVRAVVSFHQTVRRKPAQKSSGSSRRAAHNTPPVQCIGPQCDKAARQGSKYCSNECGRKLAKARLVHILPGRVDEFWKEQPTAVVRANEQIIQLEKSIMSLKAQEEKLLGYVDMIQRFVTALRAIVPMPQGDENGAELEGVGNCTVCGMECSFKQLPKHIERCFIKSEKQITFGTATQAAINPHDLFCEAHNKINNTYCKRLRVMCAEHYKGDLENSIQVCGCPNLWSDGRSQTLETIIYISRMEEFAENFCMTARKDCTLHQRWVQTVIGTLECERMNVLTKLDEFTEKRAWVHHNSMNRGDVISLLCNQTTPAEESTNKTA